KMTCTSLPTVPDCSPGPAPASSSPSRPRGLHWTTMGWHRPAAAGAFIGAVLCAQAPKPQFTFRTSAQLVQINVIVDGKSGAMAGLKPEAFRITDNGKRRPVQVFSFDDERSLAAPEPVVAAPVNFVSEASPSAASAKVFRNSQERAPGIVVVLFDALDSSDSVECVNDTPAFSSSHSLQLAKNGALAYLGKVDPRSRVALYGLGSRLRVLSDFTTDHARLAALLRAYQPWTHTITGDGSEETDVPGDFNRLNAEAGAAFNQDVTGPMGRTDVAQALSAIARHLAGLPGRISLVWFMTRAPLTGAAIEAAVANDNIAVYPVDARGLMTREPVYAQGLAPACGTFIGGRGVTRLTAQPSGQHAMEDIAQATGGRAFYNTNDFGGAIAAAAEDSMASYTLGFYIQASELADTLHRLQVRVRGKGIEDVRYPHGYWALRSANTEAPPSQAALRVALRLALNSPLDAAALKLKARVSRIGPAAILVSGNLDVHQLQMANAGRLRTGAVILATAVYDAPGKMIESSSRLLSLKYTSAEFQRQLSIGIPFQQTVELAPGAADVRFVAEDPATAAVGSLTIALDGVH